jgi:hypothetical protein
MPRIRETGEQRHKSPPSKKKENGAVNLRHQYSPTSYFTTKERRAYREAVERRTGSRAWSDWEIIMQVLRRASDAALRESGQNSRENPDYRQHFHRILSELPPISPSKNTAERYRRDLLNISYAGQAFTDWYLQTKPCANNPSSLWKAYEEATKPQDDEEKKGPKPPDPRDVELARTQEEAAAKIADLTKELNFLKGDNIEAAGQRLAGWPRDRVVAHILNLIDGWSDREIDDLYAAMTQHAAGHRQRANR